MKLSEANRIISDIELGGVTGVEASVVPSKSDWGAAVEISKDSSRTVCTSEQEVIDAIYGKKVN